MIKNLFSTPKKTTAIVFYVLATLTTVGIGMAFAVSAVAEDTSIGADEAKMFASAGAGVDPVTAENMHTGFGFEQSHFIYDVEFTVNGIGYDYWIQASDGSVVKKKTELIDAGGSRTGTTTAITQKDARKIALEDARLMKAEVTISVEKLNTENGVAVCEVNLVKGNVRHGYNINAAAGVVYNKNLESTTFLSTEAVVQPSETQAATANVTVAPATENRSNNNYISLGRARAIALSDASLPVTSITSTEAKQDFDDDVPNYNLDFYTTIREYGYEISIQTGAIMDKGAEADEHAVRETKPAATVTPATTPATTATEASRGFIGVGRAKSITLRHTGVSASSVSSSKAKPDDNNDRGVYEIEFHVENTGYDHKIDAYSGGITECDIDRDWFLQMSRFGK